MSDDPSENPSDHDAPKPRHDAYAAFREPAFRRFTLGMLMVRIGTGAQSTAVGWEMYVRTDSAWSLALVGLVQALPMLLFTLPAGYLADVLDRRRLMLAGMTGTTLTSLGLAAFSYYEGSIALMYALLFIDSTALRLTAPARTALVPQLVPAAKLENAMKWRSSVGQVAAVVGPAVGGLIIDWSLPSTYMLCAGTTALFMLLLLTIEAPDAPRAEPGGMVGQVMEGVRFVWQRKVLLGTISLDLFAVLLGGATYLLPIFARDVIHLEGTGLSEAQALGWLRSAPAVGAMAMAFLMAHIPPIRKAGWTMLWAVAAFGAATVVFGLSTNLWLSLFMLLLTGAFDSISVIVRHTLVQMLTPNEMRGRVSAVNGIFIGSSNQIGGFRAGAVATLVGPVVSVVAGGIAAVAVVAAWAGMFPALRRFGALTDSAESAEQAPTPRQTQPSKPVKQSK